MFMFSSAAVQVSAIFDAVPFLLSCFGIQKEGLTREWSCTSSDDGKLPGFHLLLIINLEFRVCFKISFVYLYFAKFLSFKCWLVRFLL